MDPAEARHFALRCSPVSGESVATGRNKTTRRYIDSLWESRTVEECTEFLLSESFDGKEFVGCLVLILFPRVISKSFPRGIIL